MASTEQASVRRESDSFGPIEVAGDRYWGAQTQRSVQNFPIGGQRMPIEIVHALALIKRAAAEVNRESGELDPTRCLGDRRGGRRGHAGQVGQPFPARRLADRFWHADEHERQRGHRQPRQRDARRGPRCEDAGASERSRQSGAILEQFFPDRDACCRGARRARATAARAREHWKTR